MKEINEWREYMSGLREGYKEPYSQRAGCIISLALRGRAIMH
jgi:hypothetical protein